MPTSSEESRLDDESHAWWAQRDIERAWTPRGDAPPPGTEQERDEQFGDDWHTSFVYDTPVEAPAPEEPAAVEPTDPYEVFGVDPSASWEEIVKARRRVVRRHHPDRLASLPDAERTAAEDRIREINAAYAELKVRRGR